MHRPLTARPPSALQAEGPMVALPGQAPLQMPWQQSIQSFSELSHYPHLRPTLMAHTHTQGRPHFLCDAHGSHLCVLPAQGQQRPLQELRGLPVCPEAKQARKHPQGAQERCQAGPEGNRDHGFEGLKWLSYVPLWRAVMMRIRDQRAEDGDQQ